MPQLSQSERAVSPAAPLRTADEPSVLTYPLTETHDEEELLDFLAENPIHTVVMNGLIRDNGAAGPFNRGTFYACRNPNGRLEGVALIGHATFVEARSEAALKSFAQLAQRERKAHMILGESELIRRFWNYYADAGQRPRLFCRELLFEQRWPVPACEPVEGLRLATLEDLPLVMPVHAALAYEESGVNPLETDPRGFRMRCARRIESGRVWLLTEDGRLAFKADIASDTPACTYIEGLYVAPEFRRKGYGLRCLTQLGHTLLDRSAAVSALINERNTAAHSLFRRAGYKMSAHYDTIFLERKMTERVHTLA